MNQMQQNPAPQKVKQRICRTCRKKYLENFLSSMSGNFDCCYIGEGIKSTLEFLSSSSKFSYMLDYIIHLTKYFTVCSEHQQICEIYEFNQKVIDDNGKLMQFNENIQFRILCKKCLIELIQTRKEGVFYYTREELNEKFDQQNQNQIFDPDIYNKNQQIVFEKLKKADFELVDFKEFQERLEKIDLVDLQNKYNMTLSKEDQEKKDPLKKLKEIGEAKRPKPKENFDAMYNDLKGLIKDFEERKIIMAEGNNHKYIHDPTIDSIDLKSDLLGQIDLKENDRKQLFQHLGALLGVDDIFFKKQPQK